MKKRAIFFLCAACLLLGLLASCANVPEEPPFSHVYATFETREVEPLENPMIAYVNWVDPTVYSVFEECDTVLRGRITNKREMEAIYYSNLDETPFAQYITLFDFTVTGCIEQKGALQIGETVTFYCVFSTRKYPSDMIPLIEGDEYVLFGVDLIRKGPSESRAEEMAQYNCWFPAHFPINLDDENRDEHILRVADIMNAPIYGDPIEAYTREAFEASGDKLGLLIELIRIRMRHYEKYGAAS